MDYNLQNHDIIVLKAITDGKEYTVDSLEKNLKLDQSAIVRTAMTLSKHKLILLREENVETTTLTREGEKALKEGLPENLLVKEVIPTPKKIQDIKLNEKNIAIGWARRKGLIELIKGNIKTTKKGEKALHEDSAEISTLKNIKSKKQIDLKNINLLKSRRFITVDTKISRFLSITDKGKSVAKTVKQTDDVSALTQDMLINGTWKGKSFRPYDVSLDAKEIYGGRRHPMTAIMDLIRDIFVEMGFKEMKSPWVETSFWCMDSMWIPQDHPARDVQDTFYLPYTGKLPSKAVVQKVIDSHENGADTGSKGYGYRWSKEIAEKLLLRTHTTSATYRLFYDEQIAKKKQVKYFYIGRVFRNEAIDATHLPEFHQVEGFVMGEDLSLKHLMGFIKEFYSKIGIDKIRFKVTYNPYTEPSLEAMYYNKKRGSWLELINSGMFRPESLSPYDIKKPVIAWGLGVERLAMTLYELGKLKEILGATCDLDWLRKYKMIIREE